MKQMQMNESDTYDAALYLRLSKDDTDIDGSAKTESNSIGNQRELLRSFVKSQPDIQIFDIYVDDGYSGSNFDRPEFKRMTSDIEAGKVNCVIVKDLSRFGREYIEAGRLIQKIYPALNVRFIAVTDHFDSKTANTSEKSYQNYSDEVKEKMIEGYLSAITNYRKYSDMSNSAQKTEEINSHIAEMEKVLGKLGYTGSSY